MTFSYFRHKMRHIVSLFTLASVLMALISLGEARSFDGPHQYEVPVVQRINRRGFKSSLLSTARGFGKRSGYVTEEQQ
jgi:hypothetical protein